MVREAAHPGEDLILVRSKIPDRRVPRSIRPFRRSGSLRSQLLTGLAILLSIALFAVTAAVMLWLPLGVSADSLAIALLILVVVDIAVVLVFGDYLLKRLMLDPIDRMVNGTRRVSAGEVGVRLPIDGSEELRSLSASINEMADRLIRHQRLLAANVRSLDETNQRLVEARAELIHAEQMASVGRLAAGIAHEIGNPLGGIMGYVEVAKRRKGSGADQEWIEGVREESKRIDRIVRGLLDYARPKAAAVRPVAVNDVVEDTLELIETQGRLKGIEVQRELSTNVPEVLADRHQLEQVLVNLLLNAADSIRAAGVDGAVTVRTLRARYASRAPAFRLRRQDDPEGIDFSHLRRIREPPEAFQRSTLEDGALTARIEIADNGTGLKEEEAQRIFDPFYTTKEPGQGTGLGLAVSARLIAGMKGRIEAEGGAEGGALFSISLPAVQLTQYTKPEEAGG